MGTHGASDLQLQESSCDMAQVALGGVSKGRWHWVVSRKAGGTGWCLERQVALGEHVCLERSVHSGKEMSLTCLDAASTTSDSTTL